MRSEMLEHGHLGGRAIARFGPRAVGGAGLGLAAVGALLLSRLGADASAAADLLPGFLLEAAGIGAAFVTAATTA